MNDKKLIEEAFPLKQASIDSVHEKNVRHGHISTLHIWPARRPLAACRAALIAALLPDPGDAKGRADLLKRIGGEVVSVSKTVTKNGKTETKIVEETVGGILHWGRESNGDVARFRDEIRAAYGGSAPKVLDMFAGGGAIPLEAMRLGCDVTAVDYNPVAWFLLKCTLEYPQKLAGKTWPLPEQQSGSDPGLMPKQGALDFAGKQRALGDEIPQQMGDLAAHVRWWGNWVLERARRDLAAYYPTLPLNPSMPESETNPLCQTIAFLWARTVAHPDPKLGGLRIPLLKTLWLCKKAGKKRAIRISYHPEFNQFQYEVFAPKLDSEVGSGTMTRTGVQCPPLADGQTGIFLKMEYLQQRGIADDIAPVCTAVVVDVLRKKESPKEVPFGKEYRKPTRLDDLAAQGAIGALDALSAELPYGLPCEPIQPASTRSISCQNYGLNTFGKLFTPRQLFAIGTFVKDTRSARAAMRLAYSRLPIEQRSILIEALTAYLAVAVDRLADSGSSIAHWAPGGEFNVSTFQRFALPMSWDFSEAVLTASSSGSYANALEWIFRVCEHICAASTYEGISVFNHSAVEETDDRFDAIVTDPPYYQAISYADLSDFFYVWLRRTIGDELGACFADSLTPKSGELVQHIRSDKDRLTEKTKYENGMAAAFQSASRALKPDGRLVIVFAHKDPAAWETLVGAMIRAGFVVTASWPIDTERGTRTNAQNSAALSSSIWLVCRKRPSDAGKGWYKQVQPRMKERITERLRYFWDIGVRGPDFLWAAVGPGLEAFSAYDEVRRNDGKPFSVSEFLKEVRRLTTDFALGQIVSGGTEGLDEWTRYALMHAANFGTAGAPVGECILLSGAYGLDLNTLTGPRGILTKAKKKAKASEDEVEGDALEDDEAVGSGSGSELRLIRSDERKREDLGEIHPTYGLPYLDILHRLMREWANGEVAQVTEYAARNGLGQNELFWKVAQAFAEMNEPQSRERTLLEAVIAWGRGRALATPTITPKPQTGTLEFEVAV